MLPASLLIQRQAADAAQKLVPQGKPKQAAEAIPDEAIDRLTIAAHQGSAASVSPSTKELSRK